MTGPWTAGRVAGMAAVLLAGFFVVTVAVPPDRTSPARLVVLTVAGLAGVTARRAFGVGTRPAPDFPERAADSTPAEEQDVTLARVDASLARAAESGEQFWRVTRPAFRRLATERLLYRRGVDVTADPEGARRLMGEELWEMFATPPEHVGPPPGRERLRLLVERLERL